MEDVLAQHVINLECTFFELSITELRKLANELKYQLHPYFKEKKMTEWFYRFMKIIPFCHCSEIYHHSEL